MKKIFSIYPFNDEDFKNQMNVIKNSLFDGVFIYQSDAYEEQLQVCKEMDIFVEAIHVLRNKADSLWNDDDYEVYKSTVMNGIYMASKYKTKLVVMHLTSFKTKEKNERGLNRMKEFVEYATKMDVILCLENVRNNEHFDYVLDSINSDHLKRCFDVGHANCFSKDLYSEYHLKNIERVVCVHLHDNNGLYDEHKIPFTGSIDFEWFVEKFMKIKNQINITFEVHNQRMYYDTFKELVDNSSIAVKRIEELFKR